MVRNRAELVAALDAIEHAAVAVQESVIQLNGAVREARAHLLADEPLGAALDALIAARARQRRAEATAAWNDYLQRVMQFRARLVRGLVDEEGHTLTAVAQWLGVSRQMATRIYRSVTPSPPGEPCRLHDE